jgi:hypothetical protein
METELERSHKLVMNDDQPPLMYEEEQYAWEKHISEQEHFEPGWAKRQLDYTYQQTAKWPDWMKKESGIHQNMPKIDA